ncbi:MAG TPA: FAD synthetase family protein [Spirochaetales bacterium]|nr:FAD synthetase family protein [Spirochaetales bacterium]HRY56466.1 FAD synthetase family protein [Spirochaetia bacterium]
MRILSWDAFIGSEPDGLKPGLDPEAASRPLAAAIGVFDGLHLGHRKLIGEVLAREGMVKGVFTFRENPKKSLRPSTFHGDLFTLEQRLETLSELGVELSVLIDFSGDFSKLAGRKFLSLLRDRGGLRFLAVGADFRCGYRLDTGSDEIRSQCAELGVEARILPSLAWAGKAVSSSRIRRAVLEGRLDEARVMLGRDFEVDLRGARFGTAGGILAIEPGTEQLAPPSGRYEAELGEGDRSSRVEARWSGGAWSIEGASPGERPKALRLLRLVSRE